MVERAKIWGFFSSVLNESRGWGGNIRQSSVYFHVELCKTLHGKNLWRKREKTKNINVVIAIISNWNCYQTRRELEGNFSIWGKHTLIWKVMSSFHIVPKSFFFKVHVQSKTPLGLFRWSTSFCTAFSTHLKTPKVVVASRWHVNTSLFCHKKQNTIAYNNSLVSSSVRDSH